MKKLLTVLCLALLLGLVCASALAYTHNGVDVSKLVDKEYNGYFIDSIGSVIMEPSCSQEGIIEVNTVERIWDDSDPKDGKWVKGTNPGPTFSLSLDKEHKWDYPDIETAKIIEENCETITRRRICSLCNKAETKTFTNTSTSGTHHYVLTAVEGEEGATCQRGGKYVYVCTYCKQVQPNSEVVVGEKADHQFSKRVDDVKDTCATGGKYHYQCKWCGLDEKDEHGLIKYYETAPHTPEYTTGDDTVVVEQPTCKKPGKSYHYCKLCGAPEPDGAGIKYITDGSIDPKVAQLNHEWTDWTVTRPATCIEGEKQRQCKLCGEIQAEKIASQPDKHTWKTQYANNAYCFRDPVTGEAAELDPSKVLRICSVCNEIDTTYTPTHNDLMALHNFVEDTSTGRAYLKKAPGCVDGEDGVTPIVCKNCGGVATRTVPHATQHNYGAWKNDPAGSNRWVRECQNLNCHDIEEKISDKAPGGTTAPAPTTKPDTPTGSENYKIISWSFSGSTVSGSVAGNVSYRTPGLSVNVIIYTPTGTFLAVNAPVDEDGHFSVSAGGAVYAVSVQLKDNNKTYQTDGKYV